MTAVTIDSEKNKTETKGKISIFEITLEQNAASNLVQKYIIGKKSFIAK